MGSNTAAIRWGAWDGDEDLTLTFPEAWDVRPCPPADAPDIGDDGVAAAFTHPIGTPPLRALARGRRRACVVVDDLTRPTPGWRLVPPILSDLAAAGIADEDVTVLVGLANHLSLIHISEPTRPY